MYMFEYLAGVVRGPHRRHSEAIVIVDVQTVDRRSRLAGRNRCHRPQRVALPGAGHDERDLARARIVPVSVTEPPSSLSSTRVGAFAAAAVAAVGIGFAGTVIVAGLLTGSGATGPPSGRAGGWRRRSRREELRPNGGNDREPSTVTTAWPDGHLAILEGLRATPGCPGPEAAAAGLPRCRLVAGTRRVQRGRRWRWWVA